jgi:AraC-like DNA-binding protein
LAIDSDQVKDLASIGCTMEEIARVVKCSVDTLERRFADTIARGRVDMKMSLRRAQLKSAIDNSNTQMLIWLGKQHLGQYDKSTHLYKETNKSDLSGDIAKARKRVGFK